VAHFARTVLDSGCLTIYGDGRQVRDLLEVADLAELYRLTIERIGQAAGRVFNVGGGPDRAYDVLTVLRRIEAATGRAARVAFGPERRGDQRYFVSDLGLVRGLLGWRPACDLDQGLPAWCRGCARSRASSPTGGPARRGGRRRSG
jgi:CDP-paratose 2-epimerase